MGKLSALLVRLGVVLLAAALGLTLYNLRQSNDAAQTAAQVLQELETALPASQKPAKAPSAAVSPQETEPKPDYVLNPDMEMPVVTVEGRDYIGLLSIPALELELPVRRDLTDGALKLSPCRYAGSVEDGGLVIAAHNYARHFAKLSALRPGDLIRLTDADGNVHDYAVAQTETLGGDAAAEMTDGRWDLTLFTCTYGGKSRLTVRCIRAE